MVQLGEVDVTDTTPIRVLQPCQIDLDDLLPILDDTIRPGQLALHTIVDTLNAVYLVCEYLIDELRKVADLFVLFGQNLFERLTQCLYAQQLSVLIVIAMLTRQSFQSPFGRIVDIDLSKQIDFIILWTYDLMRV